MTSPKQEAIFSAALDLFAERGYHGTAVPEIASKAGVGPATLYRLFDGKEALVNALYQRWKHQLALALLASLSAASGSSNASFAAVPASGYSPEKHASQCVSRVPSIAS